MPYGPLASTVIPPWEMHFSWLWPNQSENATGDFFQKLYFTYFLPNLLEEKKLLVLAKYSLYEEFTL